MIPQLLSIFIHFILKIQSTAGRGSPPFQVFTAWLRRFDPHENQIAGFLSGHNTKTAMQEQAVFVL
jgi:hypothetical protein